jgi:membrane carboxypeptidase/penicillin-binding protein
MDDGGELGLTGAEAALPIWLTFMSSALRGQITPQFLPPPGIMFTEVDPQSGLKAAPDCPNTIQEAFATGTEPVKICPIH